MNSCLYTCEVMHHRLTPKEHKFNYRIFMFYIDLDELDELHRQNWLFSRNRLNWFTFRDRDHIKLPYYGSDRTKSVKENVIEYLNTQNITWKGGTIMLLTNVTTLGHSFNPISFYLCFDKHKKPICSIAEVCNTHDEMKLYILNKSCLESNTFRRLVPKYFYVSPFADLDSSFDFIFTIPDDSMHMRVDDYQNNKRFLLTSLRGERKKLNDINLFVYGIRFPLITIKIITLIYWQAFMLYLKRLPHQNKKFNLHLQRDLYQTKKM